MVDVLEIIGSLEDPIKLTAAYELPCGLLRIWWDEDTGTSKNHDTLTIQTVMVVLEPIFVQTAPLLMTKNWYTFESINRRTS